MSVVTLNLMLRDREVLQIEEPVSPDQCERLLSLDEGVRLGAEEEILQRARRIEGLGDKAIGQLCLSVDEGADLPAGTRLRSIVDAQSVWNESPKRRLTFCRSLLSFAASALPPADRQEALDEWMDELECAAEENLPTLRRTASILFRAGPLMAVRSRGSARVRRRG